MASATHPAVRGQGRERLLAAAREVFAEKGYARAALREIAGRAGVAEPSIYWHFKSKRGLFEAAVTEPFARFVETFFRDWRTRPPGTRSAVDEATDYLTGLYRVLHDERELLLAMLADRRFGGDGHPGAPLHLAVADLLALHAELLTAEIEKRGYQSIDVHLWTRIFFATILSLAIHDDLLEAGGPIDPEAFIRELAIVVIRGASAAHAPGSASG